MKFTRHILLLFILCIAFLSCGKKVIKSDAKVIIADDWNVTDTLKTIALPRVSEALLDPIFLSVNGKYLTFIEETKDSVLKFFSLENDSLVGSYGIRGEGPAEFSGPPFILNELPNTKPTLSLLDWGRKMFYRINITDLITTNTWSPKFKFMLPPELILAQRLTYFPKESSMIGFGGVRRGKLFKYSINQDSVLKFTPFIPKLKEMDFRNPGYLYAGSMSINRKEKKIAVVSGYFEQLELYDYDLNLLSTTRLSKDINFIGDFKGDNLPFTPQTKIYYYSMDSGEDKIFVYYQNRTMEEKGKDICTENAAELHIFNWDGEPLKRYQLEGCPFQIAYDGLNNRIIALFLEVTDPQKIVQYYRLP